MCPRLDQFFAMLQMPPLKNCIGLPTTDRIAGSLAKDVRRAEFIQRA